MLRELSRSWRRFANNDPLGRIRRIGPISLLALFFGGGLLVFVGANALDHVKTGREEALTSTKNGMIGRFRHGHTFSVQAWIAIAGAGFGMLSFGFIETYYHLFDWWCSRQASRDAGLDYGRYLNTLNRSPVAYGIRGFRWFATLRYFFIWGAIAMSIGYKFGIRNVNTSSFYNLPAEDFSLMPTRLRGIERGGFASPWLTDAPNSDDNQCFFHFLAGGPPVRPDGFYFESETYEEWKEAAYNGVPEAIVMVGQLGGNSPSASETMSEFGEIFSRELVMVANMTQDEGDFEMTRDHDGWFRVETSGVMWYNETEDRAVVDYRADGPGKVQIQWAPFGDWVDGDESEPVTTRVTFNMRHAVAEVRRSGIDNRFASLQDALDNSRSLSIFAMDEDPIETAHDDANLPSMEPWINAIVGDTNSTVAEGVSAVVRAAMAGWAYESNHLQILAADDFPFGEEDVSRSHRQLTYSWLDYPFFSGDSDTSTGMYIPAAVLFVFVGFCAIAIGIMRLWAGPADLTSWAGQHVYLAQVGAITLRDNRHVLASGYSAAPTDVGTLRLYGRYRPVDTFGYGVGNGQSDKRESRDSMADDSTINLCEIKPTHSSPKF